MKVSILSLAAAAAFVQAQGGPIVGNQCGSLGPQYYAECCATAVSDPSCPTATPTGPIVGNQCGSLGPQYFAECCATAVSDPSCPTATPTGPIVGNQCGSLGPQYFAACCATAVSDPSCPTATPTGPIVGNHCDSLGPQYFAACCATAVSDPSCPTSTAVPSGLTTSTIYSTTTVTISDCPPEVINCPYRTAPVVVVSTIPAYTTVCPISIVPPPPPPPPPAATTGIVATHTTAGVIEFTGAADIKKAGTWGLAAGLAFAIL